MVSAMGEALRFEAHMARTTLRTERLACWVTVLYIAAGLACGQSFRCSGISCVVLLLAAFMQLLLARAFSEAYMKHRVVVLLSIRIATLATAIGVQYQVSHLAAAGSSSSSGGSSYTLTSTQHTLQLLQLAGLMHVLCCHGMTLLPFWYSAAIQTLHLGVLLKSSRVVAHTIMSTPSGIAWLRSAHRYIQQLVSIAELSTFPFSSMKQTEQLDDASVAIIVVIFTQIFFGLVLPLYAHFFWECRQKLILSWQAHHLSDPTSGPSHHQHHRQGYELRHVLTATLLGLNIEASYHATFLCHALISSCVCSGTWAAIHLLAPMLGP